MIPMNDEISADRLEQLLKEESDKYHTLRPTWTGVGYVDTPKEGFYLKLASEEIKQGTLPKRDSFKSFGAWQEALNRYYSLSREPRLTIPCAEEHMGKFAMSPVYPYVVPKRINDFKFEEMAEWIHTQTKHHWSVMAVMDVDNRKGRSFLAFYFETKEDAALFKLFHI